MSGRPSRRADCTHWWVYAEQSYDWKGRPVQTLNPDGSTQTFTYGGCGCAGGEVVTAEDEHGRRRRQTADALGRLAKVEEMAWNGTSVYSTTTYAYNALDQLTQINQAGQLRTFEYDGFGRLWKRTTPEQGTTEHAYNNDGTVAWVKDARGAKAVFAYNNRHLPTSVSYDLTGVIAGQNVAATPSVTFTYDAAGHRTQMSDGTGSTVYNYDTLGQLAYESRTLNGAGTYRLDYEYNLAGELKSVTNPWNAQVSYAYDRAGRVTSVGGANYAGVSSYASALAYRAFGGLKVMTYGDTRSLSTAYDNRLRLTKWDYAYHATGQQSYASATGLQQAYDGDGMRVKKTENGQTTFYLRSSVLGGRVVAEISGAARGHAAMSTSAASSSPSSRAPPSRGCAKTPSRSRGA